MYQTEIHAAIDGDTFPHGIDSNEDPEFTALCRMKIEEEEYASRATWQADTRELPSFDD